MRAKYVIIFILILLLSGINLALCEDEIILPQGTVKISPKIDSVIVYKNKAVIIKEAEIDLKKGKNNFVVPDLPKDVMPDTISVSKVNPADNYYIKEWNWKPVTVKKETESDDEKKIKDELKKAEEELNSKQDELLIVNKRVDFYSNITAKVSGDISQRVDSGKIDVDNIYKTEELVIAGMRKALKDKRDLNEDINRLKEKINILKSQLYDATKEIKGVNVLYFEMESAEKLISKIKIRYVVTSAQWQTEYSLNYDSKKGEIELKYFGRIIQTSSEKWDNVSIVLDTGTPLYNVILPEPSPWIVREYTPIIYKSSIPSAAERMMSFKEEESALKPAGMVESIERNELSMGFNLKGRHTILNSSEGKKLLISAINFDAKKLFYTVVPSVNNFAYLTLKFKNDSDLILMPGKANFYIDGNYSGNIYFYNNINTGEEKELAFGIDESIKVEKKLLYKKVSEKGFIKGKIVVSYGYRIEINNYKDKDATVYVKEPLPVSEHEKINVSIDEITPDVYKTEGRGIKVWEIVLKPNEKKSITYKFKITYPDDMNVIGK